MKVIVISEEVGAAKPGKEIFETAFKMMGYPAKEEVLIIGDSLSSDIKGGSDFGIDTCWFNPGNLERNGEIKINIEIADLKKLPTILNN